MTQIKPQLAVFSSAARTASPTAVQIATGGARGLHMSIVVTAKTSSPSIVPKIEGYDAVSGTWYTILTGDAIVDTGTTILKVYPGIGTASNAAASDVIPNRIRISMTHANSDSATYSVAAILMP